MTEFTEKELAFMAMCAMAGVEPMWTITKLKGWEFECAAMRFVLVEAGQNRAFITELEVTDQILSGAFAEFASKMLDLFSKGEEVGSDLIIDYFATGATKLRDPRFYAEIIDAESFPIVRSTFAALVEERPELRPHYEAAKTAWEAVS